MKTFLKQTFVSVACLQVQGILCFNSSKVQLIKLKFCNQTPGIFSIYVHGLNIQVIKIKKKHPNTNYLTIVFIKKTHFSFEYG